MITELSGLEGGVPFENITSAVLYRIDCIKNSYEIVCQRQNICAVFVYISSGNNAGVLFI